MNVSDQNVLWHFSPKVPQNKIANSELIDVSKSKENVKEGVDVPKVDVVVDVVVDVSEVEGPVDEGIEVEEEQVAAVEVRIPKKSIYKKRQNFFLLLNDLLIM